MSKSRLLITLIAVTAVAPRAFPDNFLQNPGFEDEVNPSTPNSSFSGSGTAGTSSVGWYFYNLANGASTADEVTPPAGLVNSGNFSLLVTESTAGNTIYHSLGGVDLPDDVQSVSGWVYLQSGSVGIGVLNSLAQPVVFASTSSTGQWINLAANTGGYETNGFVIVALSPNTVFYADNMDADSDSLTPEPSSLAALGLGALGLGRRWSRRRKQA